MTGYIIVFFVGIFLGGFIGYWFEDTLRGPIMRAYDDQLYGEVVVLTNED